MRDAYVRHSDVGGEMFSHLLARQPEPNLLVESYCVSAINCDSIAGPALGLLDTQGRDDPQIQEQQLDFSGEAGRTRRQKYLDLFIGRPAVGVEEPLQESDDDMLWCAQD